MLNRDDENGWVCNVSNMKKSIQCFTIKYDVSCTFFIGTLYQIKGFPFDFYYAGRFYFF